MTAVGAEAPIDERIARVGALRRLLLKPELGSLLGALVVFVFFAALSDVFRSGPGIANWLDPASTIGIMAVAIRAGTCTLRSKSGMISDLTSGGSTESMNSTALSCTTGSGDCIPT